MRGSPVRRIVDTLKPCDAPLLSLQIVVLNSLLSAALPTLLTTASLTTLLPMAMRVLILLYSTTLTIAHIRIVQTALVQQLKTSRLLVTAVSWGVPPA